MAKKIPYQFAAIPHSLIRCKSMSYQTRFIYCFIKCFDPCRPGINVIKDYTGFGRTTVIESLQELVNRRLILLVSKGSNHSGTASLYEFLDPSRANLGPLTSTPTGTTPVLLQDQGSTRTGTTSGTPTGTLIRIINNIPDMKNLILEIGNRPIEVKDIKTGYKIKLGLEKIKIEMLSNGMPTFGEYSNEFNNFILSKK